MAFFRDLWFWRPRIFREGSQSDLDRLSRRGGYWMIASMGLLIGNFVFSLTEGLREGYRLVPLFDACMILFVILGWVYFVKRVCRVAFRDWWSIWFSYTVTVRIDRLGVDPGLPYPEWDHVWKEKIDTEVTEWCRQNVRGAWCHWRQHVYTIFKFRRKQDAALFKLFWG